MTSAFGVVHGYSEISKLSGYDYHDKKHGHVTASRIGYQGSAEIWEHRNDAGKVVRTNAQDWTKKGKDFDRDLTPGEKYQRFTGVNTSQTTIHKSLSGGVFKPITEMTGAERAAVGGYKAMRGATPEHKKFKRERKKQIKALMEHVDRHGEGIKNRLGNQAGTYRIGGKSSGRSVIIGATPGKKDRKLLMAHEAAHANPRRSAYRLHHQIMGDPKKLFREEARADYISGGHFSQHPDEKSKYAQGARAMQGLKSKGPESNFKFDRKTKKAFKTMGMETPKIPNRAAVDNVKDTIGQQFPHYPMQGKQGDQALNAYRKLHNKWRREGTNPR